MINSTDFDNREKKPIYFSCDDDIKNTIDFKIMQLRLWEFLNIETVSEANCCQHWRTKKKRHDDQKNRIKNWLKDYKIQIPAIVKITRFSSRKLDSDNLPVSVKYIRDAIADHIFPGLRPGMADDNPNLHWYYNQQIGKLRGVKIEIFSNEKVKKKKYVVKFIENRRIADEIWIELD